MGLTNMQTQKERNEKKVRLPFLLFLDSSIPLVVSSLHKVNQFIRLHIKHGGYYASSSRLRFVPLVYLAWTQLRLGCGGKNSRRFFQSVANGTAAAHGRSGGRILHSRGIGRRVDRGAQ